jgi:hypothetical protein
LSPLLFQERLHGNDYIITPGIKKQINEKRSTNNRKRPNWHPGTSSLVTQSYYHQNKSQPLLLVEPLLPTLPEHLSSPPVVRVVLLFNL